MKDTLMLKQDPFSNNYDNELLRKINDQLSIIISSTLTSHRNLSDFNLIDEFEQSSQLDSAEKQNSN